jgi:hypothetical protein
LHDSVRRHRSIFGVDSGRLVVSSVDGYPARPISKLVSGNVKRRSGGHKITPTILKRCGVEDTRIEIVCQRAVVESGLNGEICGKRV